MLHSYLLKGFINSSPPSAAQARQWAGSTLVQVMACACSAPSYYLNHCWLIVNWTPGYKFLWNLNRNCIVFIQQNALSGEYVHSLVFQSMSHGLPSYGKSCSSPNILRWWLGNYPALLDMFCDMGICFPANSLGNVCVYKYILPLQRGRNMFNFVLKSWFSYWHSSAE